MKKEKKEVLATKEDIHQLDMKIGKSNTDLLKWMFIFWVTQLGAMFAMLRFLVK